MFHDGEPFNAEAVCTNFDRWYNFTGSFQNPSASYYWQTVFGGFAKIDPESGAPEDSYYESCEAPDESTAVITLTKPSSAILGALSLSSFSIASPKALTEFGADDGTVDADGVFQPTGTFGTEHPIGTGPFKFDSWERGYRLTLVRNDDYWGDKAKLDTLIFTPIPDNAARLQALQTGEIQGYDLVEPQDIATIEGDSNLQVLDRPAFNVGYVGINQAKPPLDKLEVRQAIAHGLDRAGVVDNFYGGRGEVAKEFMPPDVSGYADDVTEYDYDPEKSKQLLQEAGLTLPVEIEFWYPTDVSRPYMPDPKRNFEAFTASLEKSGFKVTPKTAPWSPDYLGQRGRGQHAGLPARLDRRLRRRGQLRRDVLPERRSPLGASRTRRSSTSWTRRRPRPTPTQRIALYQDANRADHGLPPGRAVRAHAAGARVPGERPGLRAEPGLAGVASRPSPSGSSGVTRLS